MLPNSVITLTLFLGLPKYVTDLLEFTEISGVPLLHKCVYLYCSRLIKCLSSHENYVIFMLFLFVFDNITLQAKRYGCCTWVFQTVEMFLWQCRPFRNMEIVIDTLKEKVAMYRYLYCIL
jgi:hypothetical protein